MTNMEMLERVRELKENVQSILTRLDQVHPDELSYITRRLSGYYGEYSYEYSNFSSGDTAWMLFSTALVLLMTVPSLTIYYGGMVKKNEVIPTLMQGFSIACLVTVLWVFVGYSLAFAPIKYVPGHSFIGDASRMFLLGISMNESHQLADTIPESVFCTYQLTFAIITPALICGSTANRMRYSAMIIFMSLWHVFAYCPIAHASWHPGGFLNKAGTLDYAGGNVVHISSGVSGFVIAMFMGRHKAYLGNRRSDQSILLTFIGVSLLWFGWFGFNAGSALQANARAGTAMLNTQIATACASLSWLFTEWTQKKQPSVLGMVSGAVAGLVAVTPASGYVDYTGAFVLGVASGPLCYYGVRLKHLLGYDDAL